MTVAPIHNVVIRADATPAIGGGHVMRCLTLADVLAQRGAAVTFACRAETLETAPALADSRHGRIVLEGPPHAEPARIAACLGAAGADLLIVDHYGWGERQETACRAWARRILVIDDLADRTHDCDLLLDQNLGRRPGDYAGLVPEGARLLIGPAYALLRPEFARLRPAALARRAEGGPVRRILVSMGLTDPGNATGMALDALARLPDVTSGTIAVRAVLGRAAPHRAAVEARAPATGPNVQVVIEPASMAEEMAPADLCIGAGGSSSWERCCLGLPSVVVVVAENQRAGAEALGRGGGARVVDCHSPDRVATVLSALIANRSDRTSMTARAAMGQDGRGVRRIALEVAPEWSKSGMAITLRPMRRDDEEQIFVWQTASGARRYARNPAAPSLFEHASWIASRLKDTTGHAMIVLADGAPCGLLRLDPGERDRWEVSILIAAEMQGRGIGRSALAALDTVFPDYGLIADIHPENKASISAFRAARFKQIDARTFLRPRSAAAQPAAVLKEAAR